MLIKMNEEKTVMRTRGEKWFLIISVHQTKRMKLAAGQDLTSSFVDQDEGCGSDAAGLETIVTTAVRPSARVLTR